MVQCCMSTTWAKVMFAVVVANFSFLVFFYHVFIFFSVLTFGLPGKTSRMHAESAHCHQEISDLKVTFLNNMDLESK